jgi:hypothetical protein
VRVSGGPTPRDGRQEWAGAPGHDLQLSRPDLTRVRNTTDAWPAEADQLGPPSGTGKIYSASSTASGRDAVIVP